MYMRLLASLAATAILAGACGGAATAPSPSPTTAPTTAPTATPTPAPTPQLKFTFNADLKTTNEVPAIANAEASCAGKGVFTLDTTKDSTGKITAATAGFNLTVTGCPAGTNLTLFHIHQAAAGANGGVKVTGKGDAANPIALATGSTAAPIVVSNVSVDPVLANDILTGPAGFYFNVHSTLNGGGVIRGQLTPAQ
jgi:CHRD domain-containing protein